MLDAELVTKQLVGSRLTSGIVMEEFFFQVVLTQKIRRKS